MDTASTGDPGAEKTAPKATAGELFLFWGCFVALIATAFGFIIRTQIIGEWGTEFGLSESQKGEILGVGLWPFAISIVLFSLIIDSIGYGKAMIFAFVCHIVSAISTIFTPQLAEMIAGSNQDEYREAAYWLLYGSTFIVALGNGTVEAVINPVVATLFKHNKTKWLNILHAGWPGGLVLGGILALAVGGKIAFNGQPIIPAELSERMGWQGQVALIFLPVAAYGLMMIFSKFPVNERVAAGVSYRNMLKEVGFLGALIVSLMICFEVGRVVENFIISAQERDDVAQVELIEVGAEGETVEAEGQEGEEAAAGETEATQVADPGTPSKPDWMTQTLAVGPVAVPVNVAIKAGVALAIATIFGLYTLSFGQPLFVFLLMIMVPLATTELGTDSWITELMGPALQQLSTETGWVIDAGWILVYTSAIMMVLRFCAGPIVHRLSPLGLLATSAALASVGLVFLSQAQAIWILAAATLYGLGKTFFWPTMLGVVAEQFPKGGALTLNTIGGVGMLAVGVLGNPLLGNLVDVRVDEQLQQEAPEVYEEVVDEPKTGIFGEYNSLDQDAVTSLSDENQGLITTIQATVKQNALLTVAILPAIMLGCYLLLIGYFKLRGGYKPQVLVTEKQEDEMMVGGTSGPAEF